MLLNGSRPFVGFRTLIRSNNAEHWASPTTSSSTRLVKGSRLTRQKRAVVVNHVRIATSMGKITYGHIHDDFLLLSAINWSLTDQRSMLWSFFKWKTNLKGEIHWRNRWRLFFSFIEWKDFKIVHSPASFIWNSEQTFLFRSKFNLKKIGNRPQWRRQGQVWVCVWVSVSRFVILWKCACASVGTWVSVSFWMPLDVWVNDKECVCVCARSRASVSEFLRFLVCVCGWIASVLVFVSAVCEWERESVCVCACMCRREREREMGDSKQRSLRKMKGNFL